MYVCVYCINRHLLPCRVTDPRLKSATYHVWHTYYVTNYIWLVREWLVAGKVIVTIERATN